MAYLFPDSRWPVPLVALQPLTVPMVGRTVHAGFPSAADDFIEEMIDLNQVLISNPTATFLWRVVGDCMIDVKIFPGDVVVVDRSLSPKHRSIVLAIIDGEPQEFVRLEQPYCLQTLIIVAELFKTTMVVQER